MPDGIDKLTLLCAFISELFLQLAREQGVRKWHYNHVIDLRQTDHNLPIILYCDGMRDGRHKLEVVDVASIGKTRTLQILKKPSVTYRGRGFTESTFVSIYSASRYGSSPKSVMSGRVQTIRYIVIKPETLFMSNVRRPKPYCFMTRNEGFAPNMILGRQCMVLRTSLLELKSN